MQCLAVPSKNGLPNIPDKHFVWRQHIDARRRRKSAALRPSRLRVFAQFGKLVMLGFLGFRADYYTLLRLLLSVQGNTATDDSRPNAYQLPARDNVHLNASEVMWSVAIIQRIHSGTDKVY